MASHHAFSYVGDDLVGASGPPRWPGVMILSSMSVMFET